KDLLEKLRTLEGEVWLDWGGPNDDQQPHPLTAKELARMLRDFQIYPRTVSQLGRRDTGGPSGRGYFGHPFESAWASYCTPRPTNAATHQRTMRLIEGDKD